MSPPLLETVSSRSSVIEYLLEDRADKRELEEALDISRTTIDRAIRRLNEIDCITYREGKWEVTLLGELAYQEYVQSATRYVGLAEARPLLRHLPPETPMDARFLADAEISLAEPQAPHGLIAQLDDLFQGSEQIKGFSSVVLPRYVPLLNHHIVERGMDAELILDYDLIEHLCADYPKETIAVFEADNARVWRLDYKSPLGLVLIDEEVVWFAVHDEDGGLKGSIINDNDNAVAWATEVFRSYRQQAD